MFFKELPKKAKKYITEGIRKGFKYTTRDKYMREARIELPRYTKSGKVSLIPDVRYECANCQELFKSNQIQVDHIDPVVALKKQLDEYTIDEYTNNTFFNKCQVLCKPCHKEKTVKENKMRKKYLTKSKKCDLI